MHFGGIILNYKTESEKKLVEKVQLIFTPGLQKGSH